MISWGWWFLIYAFLAGFFGAKAIAAFIDWLEDRGF